MRKTGRGGSFGAARLEDGSAEVREDFEAAQEKTKSVLTRNLEIPHVLINGASVLNTHDVYLLPLGPTINNAIFTDI
jgi:hypothetical protein